MRGITLHVSVSGKQAQVRYGLREHTFALDREPVLSAISKLVEDRFALAAIEVELVEASFSTVRQVVAVVNTLAWTLGVTVNGKHQLIARYNRKPNITV